MKQEGNYVGDISMDILEFIQKHNRVAIYGAGKRGQELKSILDAGRIEVECFLVTNMKGCPDIPDTRVKQFKDWIKSFSGKCPIAVCVAVSAQYAEEIIPSLQQFDICYYYLQNTDYMVLQRYFKPVDTGNFLIFTQPVSEKFGFDRGLPIDRWYIERFLRKTARQIKNVTKTLEVGEDTYSKKYFPDENTIRDVLRYDKGMDLTKWETLSANTYDVFIATQVFNFIYDVRQAIGGAYYLLNEGGTLLATVAGNISQISWVDMNDYGDYWRFTELSIKCLCQEWFGEQVEIETFGNAAMATAFIQGMAVEDLPNKNILEEKDKAYGICIGIIATKKSGR